MTQATDTDIRDLKDLIMGLDRKIDSGLADIKEEMRFKLANVEKKIDVMDTRLIEIEQKIEKHERRLWWLVGIFLVSALAAAVIATPVP